MWVQAGDCNADLDLLGPWLGNGPVVDCGDRFADFADNESGLGGHVEARSGSEEDRK